MKTLERKLGQQKFPSFLFHPIINPLGAAFVYFWVSICSIDGNITKINWRKCKPFSVTWKRPSVCQIFIIFPSTFCGIFCSSSRLNKILNLSFDDKLFNDHSNRWIITMWKCETWSHVYVNDIDTCDGKKFEWARSRKCWTQFNTFPCII